MLRLLEFLWERWFAGPLGKIEADALSYRLSPAGQGFDRKTAAVLVIAALCLILQQYTSNPYQLIPAARFLTTSFDGPAAAAEIEFTLRKWQTDALISRIWWAAVAVLTYAAIPLVLLKCFLGGRLTDHGLKIKGVLNAWPLYLLFVAVMVPLVYVFSGEERFQQTYPFVSFTTPEQVRADLWKWELAYAAQFIALEFFFRGFIVHGTKHRFGAYSVFVSMVPYVQIHFSKPLPEATASLIAGVVLGYMSLVTRSVWLGAALHIGVAWGMDSACLYRRGLL